MEVVEGFIKGFKDNYKEKKQSTKGDKEPLSQNLCKLKANLFS